MGFERYVEIGRVCLVNYGPDYGKLVTIVDVVDQNRALVDAPKPWIRQQYNFKRLSLTDITVEIPRLPKKSVLGKALVAGEVDKKWAACSWGRKLATQALRKNMTDFDRFKLMLAKVKVSAAIKRHLSGAKGAGKGAAKPAAGAIAAAEAKPKGGKAGK